MRKAMKDVRLSDGTFIPKETVLVAAYGGPMHHEEKHYPDTVFDRMRPPNPITLFPFATFPFNQSIGTPILISDECMTLADHYALAKLLGHGNTVADIPKHFNFTLPMDSANDVIVFLLPPMTLTFHSPSSASSTPPIGLDPARRAHLCLS
ncbi:hypothetical protein LXA43DRAFT_1101848 [Ganoderma leucocontextum]|nr:hypothetical protein LXA43DRAFT_1101848 [Ganoderma leucocontextum]